MLHWSWLYLMLEFAVSFSINLLTVIKFLFTFPIHSTSELYGTAKLRSSLPVVKLSFPISSSISQMIYWFYGHLRCSCWRIQLPACCCSCRRLRQLALRDRWHRGNFNGFTSAATVDVLEQVNQSSLPMSVTKTFSERDDSLQMSAAS